MTAQQEKLRRTVVQGAEQLLEKQMRLLEAFSGIDCASGYRPGNRQVAELVSGWLRELGASVEWVEEPELGIHVVGRLRPEASVGKVILAAHLDTVFEAGMTAEHPYRRDGDWAWGLGIGDCKSGVVQSLAAVEILQEAGCLPPWEIVFLFNCDEEIGSPSGSRLMEREAVGADLALVLEGGREKDGVIRLITGRRGVILGTLDVTGVEAHAGRDYLSGHSAVRELAHKILDLYDGNDEKRKIYYNVAPISGGRPNGVVAGSAHAAFCCAGLPTNEDFVREREKIHALEKTSYDAGCRTEIREHTLFPAMEQTEANHQAFCQVQRAAKLLGIPVEEAADNTATDACYYSSFGVGCVDALSAMAVGIHTTEEHVQISSLRQRTTLLAATLALLEPQAPEQNGGALSRKR